MRLAARGLGVIAACACAFAVSLTGQPPKIGYDDTPMLPGGKWHVHDGNRPQPKVVATAGAVSIPAPPDAITLVGTTTDTTRWQMEDGTPLSWAVKDGVLETGRGSIRTKEAFSDFQLHVEFATPAQVKGESQGRGNSGVFLLGRFEIQILDSYQNPTYPDGQAAAMYGQYPPLVNVSRPPGEWQSYDIVFTAPRFGSGGKLEKPAIVTVAHNGVIVHHAMPFNGPSAHKTIEPYAAGMEKGPIGLQDHGNPVRFRNIWIRPLKPYDAQ